MTDLLLQASLTPGILDDWCGPALQDIGDGMRIPIVINSPNMLPVKQGPVVDMSAFIFLDFARPEVEDRAGRYAFGSPAPVYFGWTGRTLWQGHRSIVAADAEVAKRLGIMHIPTIVSVDANDPRTTVTGARWAHLRALILCCEHVGATRRG